MNEIFSSFNEIFEDEEINLDLENWEQDEISKYWIHRTKLPLLYFNPNFKENGCPMIITQQELEQYFNQGKKIINCSSIDIFYSDVETKSEVIKKLSENNLVEEDLEYQLKNKLIKIFQSYFTSGLYIPDVYGRDLERTAQQFSVNKMKRIINMHNFGFNNYRGEMNAAVILEIPIDEQDKIYEVLKQPIEFDTEYFGITKISKVVSPKYIKGIVVKFGPETLFIKNPNFLEKNMEQNTKIDNLEQEQFLYHTEELFECVIEEFINSNLSNPERINTYISKIEQIEKKFRQYAVKITGFVGSERYKQVYEYLKNIPRVSLFVEDKTKGNGINMINAKRYYDELATKLESFFEKIDTPKKI